MVDSVKVGKGGVNKLKVLDLFSGIGGFSLGLERTGGFETVAFCEIEEYPRKVLAKHWPGVTIYEDVKELTAERLESDGIKCDVITGGFPCQDLSVAGNQKGINAERSGLWSELCRIISEVRPKYAIVENVTALLSGERGRWFQRVLGDLAEIGYDCQWHCISASNIGAEHKRDRAWIICYPNNERKPISTVNDEAQMLQKHDTDTDKAQLKRRRLSSRIRQKYANTSHPRWGKDKPGVDRTSYGIPSQMDRLGCLGNAVVPQIPQLLGYAIMEHEKEKMQEVPGR